MQPAGADARTQPRVKVSWRVQVVVGGQAIEGRATDISEGGIGLKLANTISAGQTAKVSMMIPDPKGALASQIISGTIRIAFNVLSQDGVRAGGPWIELPLSARSLLSSYIRQQTLKIG